MNFYLGFLFGALLVASVQSTPFKPCNRGVIPKRLNVQGCTATPCNVFRGKNVTAEVDFEIPEDTDVMVPNVNAIVDLWITNYTKYIPFSQKDACSTLTKGHCPLKKRDLVTYRFTMPISRSERSVNADIEVSLRNRHGEVLVCLLLPVSIW